MVAAVEVDAGQEATPGKTTDEEGQLAPPPPQPVEVARKPRQQQEPDIPHPCPAMVAVVEVDAGQEATPGKTTDEVGLLTLPPPPPPQPVEVARKPRQPTPDHPPYCWMIGEAIDALADDGGSEEEDISAFIRARYPGVPPAHDRLLRHYLGKHVAEGFFVRTALGRFRRSTEESAAEELPAEHAEAGSCKPASSVVEAKRGRGRPRKDRGSPSAPPKGRKDGSVGAEWTTPPATAGSSSALAIAAKDSVPMSPGAVAGKDKTQASSLKPKRCRRRLRGLGMLRAAESSGEALVAGKKDGSEVPYTSDKEHELALSTMDKACPEVPPTTPPVAVGGDQPLDLGLVTTTEVPEPAPTPAMDKDGGDASSIVDKDGGICTTPIASEPGRQTCKLSLMAAAAAAAGFVPVSVAGKGGLTEAPSATYKDVHQPQKVGSAPISGKKARSKALSATPKGRPRYKSAVVATGDRSALTPGNKVGSKVSFALPKLTPVIAGVRPTTASLEPRGQPRKLYPVNADEISDDPGIALLALPSQNLEVSNTQLQNLGT